MTKVPALGLGAIVLSVGVCAASIPGTAKAELSGLERRAFGRVGGRCDLRPDRPQRP